MMPLCRLLAVDGELADYVPPDLRHRAERELLARVVTLPPGVWDTGAIKPGPGLIVLDGLLVRRVGFGTRFGAEVIGEGDLLRPWQGLDHTSLDSDAEMRVIQTTRLAVIDDRLWGRVLRYPGLPVGMIEKALRRSRMLSATMAILQQPHVELRLQMLLWLLADRWGRVRSDGILLPFSLTHETIAELIAARRPTVTSALSELARAGQVTRADGGYLLGGDPPSDMARSGRSG